MTRIREEEEVEQLIILTDCSEQSVI